MAHLAAKGVHQTELGKRAIEASSLKMGFKTGPFSLVIMGLRHGIVKRQNLVRNWQLCLLKVPF